MKLASIWLVSVLAIGSLVGAPALAQTKPAGTPPANAAAPADPLKGLATERDKMRNITFYQSPASPKYVNANAFYLYFGKEDSGRLTSMRLVMRYHADEWLFINKAWAKADGVDVTPPQKTGRLMGWERDNGDGKIWEWSDAPIDTPESIAAVRRIANAKDVTVRFEGKQYYKDRTITAAQLKAMRDIIAAYEAASGKPWK